MASLYMVYQEKAVNKTVASMMSIFIVPICTNEMQIFSYPENCTRSYIHRNIIQVQ